MPTLKTFIITTTAVGGTVREFDVGENGVLSWSPPVPPNGDILYYNVIITRPESGELVDTIEQCDNRSVDLSAYRENDGKFRVKV